MAKSKRERGVLIEFGTQNVKGGRAFGVTRTVTALTIEGDQIVSSDSVVDLLVTGVTPLSNKPAANSNEE